MSMEYPCIYFEKNGRCRKFSDDTAVSYCVMGPCPEQTLSNADRIRAMSDEELANWLCNIIPAECCDMSCPGRENCKKGHKGLLDWFQQPAEEDNNETD